MKLSYQNIQGLDTRIHKWSLRKKTKSNRFDLKCQTVDPLLQKLLETLWNLTIVAECDLKVHVVFFCEKIDFIQPYANFFRSHDVKVQYAIEVDFLYVIVAAHEAIKESDELV